MGFRELSDREWTFIEPLLPSKTGVSKARFNDRLIMSGILYILTTRCRWMGMSIHYGSYKTAWRLKCW